MVHSTAATKSLCLTLALHALVGSSAAAPGVAATHSQLDPVVLLRPLPVDLPSHVPAEKSEEGREAWTERNASAHSAEDEFDLPAELATLIAAARARPAAAATRGAGVRYYAAHRDGAPCAAKAIAAFDSWEEAHASREDCCAAAFGWDYRACMEDNMEDERDRVSSTHDTLAGEEDRPSTDRASGAEEGFELPAELAAMIAAARTTQRDAEPEPWTGGDEAEVRYYPTHEEGAPCAAKAAADVERWEEAHATLAECCAVAFGWDYDACVGHGGHAAPSR